MKYSKKIVLDFDDTIVKSSEEIIRQLNNKYNLNRNINDLKDWGYKSIYANLSKEEVLNIYDSESFFQNVKYNDCFLDFKEKYIDSGLYYPIICSKGKEQNLKYKEEFCLKLFNNNVDFIGMKFSDKNYGLNKSQYDFTNTYFVVDDNTQALLSLSSPKKILLKNYREQVWNKTPINEENIYVVNSFKDIIDMCDFDEEIKRKGISIIL